MKHHLNFDKEDDNYILLGEIFKIIDSRISRKIIASQNVKNIEMFVLSLKIIFTGMFFDLNTNFIINNLNNNKKLRNFFNIEEIPETTYINNYFSDISEEQTLNISNRILNSFKIKKRRKNMVFIVDATPIDLDFNINRTKKTKKHLKKLDLKWSYSSSKGFYIGFKATVVIEHKSVLPVAILLHSGAPHDSKLFEKILEELRKRRITRQFDLLIFDKGYYSYKNYQLGIIKYKIIPFIFPKKNFKKTKLNAQLSYPLEIFDPKKPVNNLKKSLYKIKKEINDITGQMEKLQTNQRQNRRLFQIMQNRTQLKKNTQIYTQINQKNNHFKCIFSRANHNTRLHRKTRPTKARRNLKKNMTLKI
jgi:hypothetical protein